MIRDTWRAILVVAVVTILRHDVALWQAAGRAVSPPPPAPPPVYGNVAPVHGNVYHWTQPQQIVVTQPPERPLRRVAAALTEVGDSLIGVVR